MKANIVLRGNAIFDSVQDEPFQGYVAINGNKIAAVGKDQKEADAYIDKDTKVYDFKDNLIMPGFNDSHVHITQASISKRAAHLAKARSEEECAKMVADYEKEHPSDGWIFGFNWCQLWWDKTDLPSKESLDKYFKDRPVLLLHSEGHSIWVNSKALELSGINKDTEVEAPWFGTVVKDANGEPTGVLDEYAATPAAALAFNMPLKKQLEYLRPFMHTLSKHGVTSVVDVQPMFNVEMSFLKAIVYLNEVGELDFRAHIAGGLYEDLDLQDARRRIFSNDMVRLDYLKEFSEGIFPTHTCLLLEDYSDDPGNKGVVICDLDKLEKSVMEAHKRGYTVKLHAQADRAVRLCLDMYEKAIKKYGPRRHMLEHCEMVDVADRPRFKELDVIASMQPEHVGFNPTWEGHEYRLNLGEERAWNCWPCKSMLEATGHISIGTDCPVVDVNPYFPLNRAITREMGDGEPKGGLNPNEKLTLAEAIRGFTADVAYGLSREDELGTLEAGKFADVVVVDRNLFKVDVADIRNAQSALTICDGRVVFEA